MKVRFLSVLAVGALAGPVAADSIGPGGTFGPGGFGNLKLPAAISSTVKIPISFHKSVGAPNAFSAWAGVRFHLNIIDPNEATFLGFKPDPGFIFTGGGSALNSTIWVGNASKSGQSPPLSQPVRLGSFNVHASPTPITSTNDITFKSTVFNIYHVGPQPNSASLVLEISDWVYVPPGATTSVWGDPGVPPPPVGGGTWLHVQTPKTFHAGGMSPGVSASWFFGTSINITHQGGIDLIPAPGAIALLAGGMGMVGLARRRRRVADN